MIPDANEPIVTLLNDGGETAVKTEYRFDAPPAKMWEFLTDPKKLRFWFPCEMTIQLREKGSVIFTFPDDRPETGSVVAVDENRLLAYTWGEELLRWTLKAVDDGCRLVLTDVLAKPSTAANVAAGWHLTFLGLDDLLHERELGQDPAIWDDFVRRYRTQFANKP
ncbi:SRPBCC domain-containing protein [Arthrobacter roseus]|uniref:SRPBCC domain-containing protein n=1 Tax=Arthrobacter roseus TaxID=136274 RepID=UPI00196553BA|nr:uncharacterized protein YndB with AHSA1/START domain [Arthrobacter roseus]